MGAWSVESFGNDTACDWSYGLEGTNDLRYVEEAIAKVHAVPTDKPLDADIAEEAIAAAEVVARLLGNAGELTTYTKVVDEWVANHPLKPSNNLVDEAASALRRILTPPSELRELWDDGNIEQWEQQSKNLIDRINPS